MSEPVECRSDNDYPGLPLAVHWQGERREVDRVLSGWLVPDGKCYRIITRDGWILNCCYSAFTDAWTITEIEVKKIA